MPSFGFRVFALSIVCASCVDMDTNSFVLGELESLDPPLEEGSLWPALSVNGDEIVLSWQESDDGESWFVKTATMSEVGWSPAHTVAQSEPERQFFVNWADFASVRPVGDGILSAHWLVRGPAGGYDYGIRFARSTDGGATWTEPWTPHEDGTATEHGFVSKFPLSGGGVGMVWLDGRNTAGGHGSGGETSRGAMTLRYRSIGGNGVPGPEELVDESICDCCQTDAAMTSLGPVVVYRDRTNEEIRDIYVTRLVDGKWTPGTPVHEDLWVIPACPVNGPAVAAMDQDVAVAWFTGGQEDPRVQVVFSGDTGETFGLPTRVDDGNPLGRVDVVLLRDGSAVVAWMERKSEGAEVRVRRVTPEGGASSVAVVTTTSPGRDSGFPQMIQDAKGRIVFAWTQTGDAPQIRMARTVESFE